MNISENTKDMDIQISSLVGGTFGFIYGAITLEQIAMAAVLGFVGAFFAAFGTFAFKKITGSKTDEV